ncbi:uncharacterized protein TRAVEDRAFT_113893, partial [Trametes versicolor FP-101664 SS1]|uniref:uncharacterized protein n=1 Tax=Trametes versicolor (strain FP-101664) TaxID=717944 RepID=UPI0004623660
GRDLTRSLILRTDNVQQYLKRREARIGRESAMKVGMSAMASEVLDFTPQAFDVDDKLRRIREDKRKDLTVNQLLSWIDFGHTSRVSALHWLQALVTYVPELEDMKTELATLFRTHAGKIPLPRHKTDIYPMPTVGKNENITTEFRDALLDFLGQIGQKDKDYDRRLVLIGGDGLTYEHLLQIKGYMADQEDDFRRFELVEPFLKTWHTGMTHLSMLNEVHWGSYLTADPSKLGYTAGKIGQKAPSNLKKWDYYPTAWRTWLDLDTRMLDCWRVFFGAEDLFDYFKSEHANKQVPTLAELLEMATTLYHRYASQRAYESAREGVIAKDGKFAIPDGKTWQPSVQQSSSATVLKTSGTAKGKQSKSGKEKATVAPSEPFAGDQSLSDSIMLMHESILSRELAQAVAVGDPGRVYEAVKVSLFSFAGSSHTKYTGYTLEMIVNLELESSPALKEMFLKNWLINPSGESGRWVEGDIHLEHINLILETMLEHKDAEWDDAYIRTVVAPNVSHFVTRKNTYREGLGLAKRRSAHTSPHCRPEVIKLLEAFKEEDLHRFRKGQHYAASGSSDSDPSLRDVNLFAQGLAGLREGRLEKWKAESRARRMHYNEQRSGITGADTKEAGDADGAGKGGPEGSDDGAEADPSEVHADDGESSMRTEGIVVYSDGELVVDYGDWTLSDVLASNRAEETDADALELGEFFDL